MRITCISDLHGHRPVLRGGDLLIIAGDLVQHDSLKAHIGLLDWVKRQPYEEKIIIAGNHDGVIMDDWTTYETLCADRNINYLQDSGCVGFGFKFWGMPWTPPFFNWYFMAPPEEMKRRVDSIPLDTQILITHGPARGILDVAGKRKGEKKRSSKFLGCPILRTKIGELKDLRLHVFGHIHGSHGSELALGGDRPLFVNACIVDEDYDPVNEPTEIVSYNPLREDGSIDDCFVEQIYGLD